MLEVLEFIFPRLCALVRNVPASLCNKPGNQHTQVEVNMYTQEDIQPFLDDAVKLLKDIADVIRAWEATTQSFKELYEIAYERHELFLEWRQLMREQQDTDRKYIDKRRSTQARAYNARMFNEKARQVMRRRKMLPRHRTIQKRISK